MANQTNSRSLSNENDPSGDRSAARQRFIASRQHLPAAQRALLDQLLCERLLSLLAECHGGMFEQPGRSAIVAMYSPIRAEPDLAPVAEWLRCRGGRLAFPRVVGRDQPLSFGLVDVDTVLRTEAFGVRVPDPFVTVQPDLLVIPCVAFRADGYRLGYGGGYYDRTLAARPVPAIGVAYDELQWPGLLVEPHDRRLDWIVTPTRTLPSDGSVGVVSVP